MYGYPGVVLLKFKPENAAVGTRDTEVDMDAAIGYFRIMIAKKEEEWRKMGWAMVVPMLAETNKGIIFV